MSNDRTIIRTDPEFWKVSRTREELEAQKTLAFSGLPKWDDVIKHYAAIDSYLEPEDIKILWGLQTVALERDTQSLYFELHNIAELYRYRYIVSLFMPPQVIRVKSDSKALMPKHQLDTVTKRVERLLSDEDYKVIVSNKDTLLQIVGRYNLQHLQGRVEYGFENDFIVYNPSDFVATTRSEQSEDGIFRFKMELAANPDRQFISMRFEYEPPF